MKYYGVNLGGWLVLERWITPSLFDGLRAQDEYSFCEELGDKASERLEQHRRSFITEEDIKWIKDHGLDAVRVPVPHWLFGDSPPFIGCAQHVERLLEMAAKHELAVLIDLHTAPGSQNGWDHSGRSGVIGWPTSKKHTEQTLVVLRRISDTYGNHPNVIGIETLNEPHPTISQKFLLDFYNQAVETLHPILPGKFAVFSDAFRPKDWGKTVLAGRDGTVLDLHLYQAFDKADKKLSLQKHIKKAREEWSQLIADVQKTMPVIVGEWSLGLDPIAFRGLDDFARDKEMQAYARAQMEAFDQALGWFFWTYKTENMAGWSYRDSVKRGWLPDRLVQ